MAAAWLRRSKQIKDAFVNDPAFEEAMRVGGAGIFPTKIAKHRHG